MATNQSISTIEPVNAEKLPKAEAAAQQAIRFDPVAYGALGFLYRSPGNDIQSETAFAKRTAEWDTFRRGRQQESLAILQKVHDLEPLSRGTTAQTAVAFWLNGKTHIAIAMLKHT